MKLSTRLLALLAYLLPVISWIYIGVFQRKDSFARFHLRQSIGVFLIFVIALVTWAVVGWFIAWIPYGFILSVMLFSLVIAAALVAVVAWILGIVNALASRKAFVPIFGRWADRFPI